MQGIIVKHLGWRLGGFGIEEASDTRAFTSDWRVSGVWV